VDHRSLAIRAASRFKSLHRKQVWHEVTKHCGVESESDYAQMLLDFSHLIRPYAKIILRLEDILERKATQILLDNGKNINEKSVELYDIWLTQQHW